jgi:hypothetical protein
MLVGTWGLRAVGRCFGIGAGLLCALLAFAATAAQAAGPEGALDARAWELVSPAAKSGGEVEAPGAQGAGALQAASAGGAIAFGSASSFGPAEGAPPVSQYLAGREESAWSTANLSPQLLSGTYSAGAYELFSTDLSRALLTNGWRCRGAEPCEAEDPPLAFGAPMGYRNLYLREGTTYTPLIATANAPWLSASPESFHLALEGATPDLRHVVIAAESNLYEWSEGSFEQLNGAPGATLAAPSGAISEDGQRVYLAQGGNLYLREGNETKQLDQAQGGGGAFQVASTDGLIAYFTKASHLYSYDAATEQATDLTPGGEVQGVLGASEDGSYLYYLAATGLFLYHEGVSAKIANAADLANTPPSTGTAQVSADGTRLAFASTASLTGYANVGKDEVFLYEAAAKHLLCVSCRPNGTTPSGSSSLPAARSAGEGGSTPYKPRALSQEGTRLFFDSADTLLLADSDGRPDVYEWEAKGTAACTKSAGCIGLISGGRAGEGSFADASADGTDAYFLSEAPLLGTDADAATDLYDARAGGGFAEPPPQIPCEGDDCQGPPPGPEDPTPGTATLEGPPNPPARFAKAHGTKKHRHQKRHKHDHRKGGRK